MGSFRFALAIAVVIGHAGGLWGRHPIDAEMAVQCFFMVSGFLIALILDRKYDTRQAGGLSLFYSNRALRIFGPYWFFLVFIVAVALLVNGSVPSAAVAHWHEMTLAAKAYVLFSNLFIITQDWMFWLVHDHGALRWVVSSDGMPGHLWGFFVIPQAWTLALELMFYALAPFIVRRHSLWLIAYICFSYFLRAQLSANGFNGAGFWQRFFPAELGLFLAGVLAYRAFDLIERRGPLSLPISAACTVGILSMLVAMRYWDWWESHRFFILVAIALPGLFHFSQRFAFDRWLGELSYPIYLVHLAVLSWIAPLQSGLDKNSVALGAIVTTVAVAAIYVRLVDAPFERFRQRRATCTEPQIEKSPLPA